MARPSRSIRSASRRSCSSNLLCASIIRTTTSAKRTARSASDTDSFSSLSSMRERRRRPAVSNTRNSRPFQVTSTAMESRVVPASGLVSKRSSPRRRLIIVDLPAFGRPSTATRIGRAERLSSSPSTFSKESASSSSSWSTGSGINAASASYSSLRPSPCSAEIGTGSPRPSA